MVVCDNPDGSAVSQTSPAMMPRFKSLKSPFFPIVMLSWVGCHDNVYMSKRIELLHSDWFIRCLHLQAVEQVPLIKWYILDTVKP